MPDILGEIVPDVGGRSVEKCRSVEKVLHEKIKQLLKSTSHKYLLNPSHYYMKHTDLHCYHRSQKFTSISNILSSKMTGI